MPKLSEIIDMFERFGFAEAEVRKALASGDSAHNAFESLKVMLDLRWADINQEKSADEIAELKPLYYRIQGITMTARKTKRAQAKKRKHATLEQINDIMANFEQKKAGRMTNFVEKVGKEFEEMNKRGELDEAAKQRVRNAGFGAYIDDG